ncbi:MAG: tetratricopeptide repeat protein [Nitrosopumilaceae archaeon]
MANPSADSLTIQDLYTKSHAIVIGISNYQEEELRLKNPINDAKEMAKILKEKYGFDSVKLIVDKEAAKQKLDEIFIDYIRSDDITEKDRLLVYYSGHGDIRSSEDHEGRAFEESYLIPYDAKGGVYSSYVNMNSVTNNCLLCKAKHVLLIFDSCYSGTAFIGPKGPGKKPKKITDEYLRRIIKKRTIQALAATDKVQVALDSGLTSNHGAFTGCLLNILNDDIDPDNDGILTASEVGAYLEKKVPRSGIPQNPIHGHLPGSEVGEFIFNVFNVSKSKSTSDREIAGLDREITMKELRKRNEQILLLTKELEKLRKEQFMEPQDTKLVKILKQAHSYFDNKKYVQALKLYDKALKDQPNNSQVIAGKGQTLLKLGQYEDAIKFYDKALELDPESAAVWGSKGDAFYKLGKHKDAIMRYDKVIMIDPNDANAWYNKGQALRKLRQDNEAAKCFRRVLEIDPEDVRAKDALEALNNSIR